MACSAKLVWATFVLAAFVLTVETSMVPGNVHVHAEASKKYAHFEDELLPLMEDVLGSEHRIFVENRLNVIKQSLTGLVAAVPKNENGKLGHAAVSYVLHRFFVQRHAWFIIGLEPFKALGDWNSSMPTSVIEQHTPAYISGLFNACLAEHGFGLHELAVLAATLEYLVHKESLLRLSVAYKTFGFSIDDVLSTENAHQVMDTYMAMYVLGPLVQNLTNVSTARVRSLRANVTKIYPTFPATQRFLWEVWESMEYERDYLSYADLASLVEEIGDRYGRWQDHECRDIKDMLVDMEDKGTGGAGRMRLADLYKAALYDGKWQLTERVDYLRKLGALDESDPDNLRVIIPNYVNSPSNCVASSSYYSVCCMDECEEILSHVEMSVAAPEATPTEITKIITKVPLGTVPGSRTLSPWLLHRLNEVAEHNGGLVPLHGRLFAQWLHYAYPRECSYPHALGATSPQTPHQFMTETQHDFVASETDMKLIIESPAPCQKSTEEADNFEEILKLESAMWTMKEELVVVRSSMESNAKMSLSTALHPWLRFCAFALLLVSVAFSFARRLTRSSQVVQK